MRAPMKLRASYAVDEHSLAMLDAIAEQYEGNRSYAMRQIIREAAERRGIVVGKKPAEGRNGGEDAGS